MSREQVGAELQSAKIAGQVTSAELDYPPRSAAPETGKTREGPRRAGPGQARGEYTFGELDAFQCIAVLQAAAFEHPPRGGMPTIHLAI